MITVITVLKSGGDYDEKYAVNLRRGVAQHLDAEHRFICLNDIYDTDRYDEETGIRWLPLVHGWPGWWSKVEIFRPDIEHYGRMLFIDLSCIPVGSIDEIAGYDGTACITSDWYYGGPSQSVLNFSPGSMREVWDLFNSRPEYWMKEGDKRIAPDFGDQILVNRVFGHDGLDRWQDKFPGHVVSFKEHCKKGVPDNARLVKFHGRPRIHECDEPWVRAAWNTGFRKAEYVDGVNTPIETILDQVKYNCEHQDVPWLSRPVNPTRHVCIVGGSPSLSNDLNGLRLRRRLGHKIWAMNGAANYLIANRIIPDACVIMDAREENIRFVESPHKRVDYMLCSRVNASLFDALDGYKVTMWHSYDDGVPEYLADAHNDKPWAAFTGGNTVALRSMTMAAGLGFRFIHMYGVDSSYDEGENHAYEQVWNNGERIDDVFVGDKMFRSAPWMIRQVELFREQFEQLSSEGVKISVHGEGLLPYVASLMGTNTESSFN